MTVTRKAPLGALALLVLAAPALTAPAQAQEGASADWTGPYIGGSLGYGWRGDNKDETIRFDTDGDGDFDDTVTAGGADAFTGFCGGAANGATPAAGCGGDRDGTAWTLHAGYDMQFGNVVAGAVIEGGKTNVVDSVSGFSSTPAAYTMSRSLDWNGALRARLGYAFNSGTLVYGTGGVAYGKIDNRFGTTNSYNSFTETKSSEKAWGWVAGGGVEQKVGDHMSVGVLYRYTRFNPDEYRVTAGQGTPPSTTNPFVTTPAGSTDFARDDKFDNHSVAATVSYRF